MHSQNFANKIALSIKPVASPAVQITVVHPSEHDSPVELFYNASDNMFTPVGPVSPAETFYSAHGDEDVAIQGNTDEKTDAAKSLLALSLSRSSPLSSSTRSSGSSGSDNDEGASAKDAPGGGAEPWLFTDDDVHYRLSKLPELEERLSDVNTKVRELHESLSESASSGDQGVSVQAVQAVEDFISEFIESLQTPGMPDDKLDRADDELKELQDLLDKHERALVQADVVATLRCMLLEYESVLCWQGPTADTAPTAVGSPESKITEEFVEDHEAGSWVHVADNVEVADADED